MAATRDEQNSYNNNRHQSHQIGADDEKYIEDHIPDHDEDDMKRGHNEQQGSQKSLPLVDTFMRSRNPQNFSSRGGGGPASGLHHQGYSHGEADEEQNSLVRKDTNTTLEHVLPNNASSTNTNTIPMMRSKDSVNQYLKTTTANIFAAKQLTSIEEKSCSTGSSSENASSISAMTPAENHAYEEGNALTKTDLLHTQPAGQKPISSEGNELEPEKPKHTKSQRKSSRKQGGNYPDLGFLENDVGLWDAFFLHGKNSRSHR